MLFFNLYSLLPKLSNLISVTFNNILSRIIFPTPKLFKISVLFREGFFVDELQRNSLDKLLRKLLISSAQFFNINFYNYKFIKFLIDDVYKIFNSLLGDSSSFSLSYILKSLIFYFLFLFNFIISLYFLTL